MAYRVLRQVTMRPARLNRATAAGAVAMMLLAAPSRAALVSACSGVYLPPSAVTGLIQPVLTGIVTPVQTTVNGILGLQLIAAQPGVPAPLNINLNGPTGLLATAAGGTPVILAAVRNDGVPFGPGDTCNTTTDSVQLNTPAGLSLGGNKITGLGSGTVATAGSLTAIALGNGATTTAGVANAVALGTGANATIAGGVAIGANSVDKAATATAGATIGGTAYTFAGTTPASVVSVGAAGAERQIANVAAGQLSATSTDAVNGSQLFATNTAVNANAAAITTNTASIAGNTTAITNLDNGTAGTVQRTATPNTLVLVGSAPGNSGTAPGLPQTLSNVAPGLLTPGSTDAVNGTQLYAVNQQVQGLVNGQLGAFESNNAAASPAPVASGANASAGGFGATATGAGSVAVGNGATSTGTGSVALGQGSTDGGQANVVSVGGVGSERRIVNVAAGVAPTDAVNVSQLTASVGTATANAVLYDTVGGVRANSITLAGGAAGPVTITNVASGLLTAGSTDAVNGNQLYAVNQQVQGLVNGQLGAFQSNNAAAAPAPVASGANASAGGFGATATGAGSVAVGNGATSSGTGSVAIGQGSTDGGQSRVVSVGGVGSERRITNVAAAINSTDAVNLSQLQAVTNSFTATTNGLQNEINQTNFDLNNVRRRANAGTAGAMAVAGLPQAFEPGKSMVGGAIGYWADQVAFAVGVSSIVGDRTVVKAGGSISAQGAGGFNAGVGFQF